MACGVPTVAALEGVGASLVKDSGAGVAVPCEDVAGLGRALEEVLADQALRERYSVAARHYAEAHFDADKVVDAYERTLLTAIAHRRG
jgi:colanic acid biosynthesis glycosyl transferase WcaI